MAGRGAVGVTFGWRPGVDGSESHRAQSLSGPHQGASAPTGRPNGPLLHGGGGVASLCVQVDGASKSAHISKFFSLFKQIQETGLICISLQVGGGRFAVALHSSMQNSQFLHLRLGSARRVGENHPPFHQGGDSWPVLGACSLLSLLRGFWAVSPWVSVPFGRFRSSGPHRCVFPHTRGSSSL